jgi:hypothetical protein
VNNAIDSIVINSSPLMNVSSTSYFLSELRGVVDPSNPSSLADDDQNNPTMHSCPPPLPPRHGQLSPDCLCPNFLYGELSHDSVKLFRRPIRLLDASSPVYVIGSHRASKS